MTLIHRLELFRRCEKDNSLAINNWTARPGNRMIQLKDSELQFEITSKVLNYLGVLFLSFGFTKYTTK